MRTILHILSRAGGYRSELYLRIENPPYMALVIEATPEPGPLKAPAISVAHYGEQNGDLMRDPEMCFELTNPLGMGWTMTAVLLSQRLHGHGAVFAHPRRQRTTSSIPTSCTNTSSSPACGTEISAHRASLKPSSAAANPPLSGRAHAARPRLHAGQPSKENYYDNRSPIRISQPAARLASLSRPTTHAAVLTQPLLTNWPSQSKRKAFLRRLSCGPWASTSRSWPERGAIARRNWPDSKPRLSASSN